MVGAHLSGLPLNGQLTERGARLREATLTAPRYRLYALPSTTPPKPGLLRVESDGASIAVEVWEMPSSAVGSFLALIPPPLGLGSVELADGRCGARLSVRGARARRMHATSPRSAAGAPISQLHCSQRRDPWTGETF